MAAHSPQPSSKNAQSADSGWDNRQVIVALSGGIACYKVASLVSKLVQAGGAVRVLMTQAATRFVGPMTFESLTGQAVTTGIWHTQQHYESAHVELARWCELFILAPASADIIAKLAAGLCDDIVCLTACALPSATPVLVVPAMNEQMWRNPITQRNLTTVKNVLGCHTVGPDEGWQACRTTGVGRMSEPDRILATAAELQR